MTSDKPVKSYLTRNFRVTFLVRKNNFSGRNNFFFGGLQLGKKLPKSYDSTSAKRIYSVVDRTVR